MLKATSSSIGLSQMKRAEQSALRKSSTKHSAPVYGVSNGLSATALGDGTGAGAFAAGLDAAPDPSDVFSGTAFDPPDVACVTAMYIEGICCRSAYVGPAFVLMDSTAAVAGTASVGTAPYGVGVHVARRSAASAGGSTSGKGGHTRKNAAGFGNVAILVVNRDAAMLWGKRHQLDHGLQEVPDLRMLCLKPELRSVVLADVHSCCDAAALHRDQWPRAVHLVSDVFTIENGLLIVSASTAERRIDPVTGCSLISPSDMPLLNRRAIRAKYGTMLKLLADVAQEDGPPRKGFVDRLADAVASARLWKSRKP